MGEVYLAQDTRLNRKVAIKLLRKDLPSGDWHNRLGREATLLAQLNHPNVVNIYDIIELEDEGLALVMEYIEGHTLHILLRERKVDTVERLRWLAEIASGLSAAHGAGIAHHDLKAENVLIGKDNIAKITDFGIAELEPDYTEDALALGKLAGQLLQDDPAISPTVTHLVKRLTNKMPTMRPDSAAAAAEFRRAWHEQTQEETPLPGDISTPAGKIPFVRTLAALIVMLGVVIAAVYVLKPDPQREFVAILPTVIAAHSPLTERQQLSLRATIQQAMQQSVIDSKGLALISSGDTLLVSGTHAQKARALGADSLLASSLHCEDTSCQLTIERLEGEEATVTAQRSFGILTDSPLESHEAVQRQWHQLFPTEPTTGRAASAISAGDYRKYLHLHEAFVRSSIPAQAVLTGVEDVLGRADRFLPLYRLYTDVSLHLYEDMGDTAYLDRLEDILTRAQNWAGGSFFLQRSWFLLAIHRSEFNVAANIIEQLRASREDDFLIEGLSGQLYYEMGDYSKAEAHYARAVILRPGITSYYARARNLFYLGQNDQSMASLTSLLELYPYHTGALGLQGLILLEAGELAPAVKAFTESLAIQPQNSLQRSNLGLAYMLQGEYGLARDQFELSYERGSRDPILVLNLADAESMSGNAKRAADLYQSLIDRFEVEQYQMDMIAVSQAFAQLGRYEEALAALKYIENNGDDGAEISFNAALVYTLAGQNISALVEIRQSLAGGMSGIWFTLAWFDRLCPEPRFSALLEEAGVAGRCPPQAAAISPAAVTP